MKRYAVKVRIKGQKKPSWLHEHLMSMQTDFAVSDDLGSALMFIDEAEAENVAKTLAECNDGSRYSFEVAEVELIARTRKKKQA